MRRALLTMVALLALPVLASAQPPNKWHPYPGGLNCIQTADSGGNFNCSALATVNPLTGAVSFGGTVTFGSGSFPAGIVLAPSGTAAQVLGAGDLVVAKTANTVATAGPGTGLGTFRVRPSPTVPGSCRVTFVAGTSFVEMPVAFLNTALPLTSPTVGANMFDYIIVDIPGGPAGC